MISSRAYAKAWDNDILASKAESQWYAFGTWPSAFEQISGLKINFHKRELFCFREAKEVGAQYADLIGWAQVQFLSENMS